MVPFPLTKVSKYISNSISAVSQSERRKSKTGFVRANQIAAIAISALHFVNTPFLCSPSYCVYENYLLYPALACVSFIGTFGCILAVFLLSPQSRALIVYCFEFWRVFCCIFLAIKSATKSKEKTSFCVSFSSK